jgi:GTP-binding protein HflX
VRAALRAKYPDAILLSAKSPADVAALRETIIAFFEAAMVEDQIVLPYAKQGLLGDVYENARVLSEDYDTTGRIMKVRGLPGAIARLRRTLAAWPRGQCGRSDNRRRSPWATAGFRPASRPRARHARSR